jgi:nucleoside-diphosphate-sugar epimerase
LPAIVITGASGFIGRHLVTELLNLSDAIQIRGVIHHSPIGHEFQKDNLVFLHGDFMRPETLEGLFEQGCTVVNLAYLPSRSDKDNLLAMTNLADACIKAGIRRMIHCSTAVVAGNAPDDEITEETPCIPASTYEFTKLEVEKLLSGKAHDNFEFVILRPTAVFGFGGKNLLKLTDDLVYGNRTINYLKSCLYGYRKMNLVCIDNVVSAITFLIKADKNIIDQETFIISDDDDLNNNYRYVERHLINTLGFKSYSLPQVIMPGFLFTAALKLLRRSNTNPKRVYSAHKLMAAGYTKKISFDKGFKIFAECFLSKKEDCSNGKF